MGASRSATRASCPIRPTDSRLAELRMAVRVARLLDWIESRTGLGSLVRRVGRASLPGGPRWSYVFGSALVLGLLLQTITGALLTLYYVPSAEHARTTVEYVQKVVPL